MTDLNRGIVGNMDTGETINKTKNRIRNIAGNRTRHRAIRKTVYFILAVLVTAMTVACGSTSGASGKPTGNKDVGENAAEGSSKTGDNAGDAGKDTGGEADRLQRIRDFAEGEGITIHYETVDAGSAGYADNTDDKSGDTSGGNGFEIVFITDSHISLCDNRDPDLMGIAEDRYMMIRDYPQAAGQDGTSDGGDPAGEDGASTAAGEPSYADDSFDSLLRLTDIIDPDLLILGGDTVDSAMYRSIDFVTDELKDKTYPYIYTIGNHDFEYGDEYYSEKAYSEYLPRLSGLTKSVSGCQVYETDDLIVLAVDDDNNKLSKQALQSLKEVYHKGKPVIVVSHLPFEPEGDDSLLTESIGFWGADENGKSRVVLGDDALVPDDVTREFMELMTAEDSPVILVLAGHIHFYHKDKLDQKIVQVVGDGGFTKSLVYVKITSLP